MVGDLGIQPSARLCNGMDLFDIVEMFFDWKAASERGEEPAMNLSVAFERFE